ncbi:MAG: glycosyltransferase family 2 protein, partial [Solirubrobacteraceae bacterium]
MNPHLSVVTPVHNGAAYIEQNIRQIVAALDSVGRSFEVIVVCDGCSDSTADEARRVSDSRISVLSYGPNQGKGNAIIFGVNRARGRLIAWLDSDLDITPATLVHAVERFDESEIDAV